MRPICLLPTRQLIIRLLGVNCIITRPTAGELFPSSACAGRHLLWPGNSVMLHNHANRTADTVYARRVSCCSPSELEQAGSILFTLEAIRLLLSFVYNFQDCPIACQDSHFFGWRRRRTTQWSDTAFGKIMEDPTATQVKTNEDDVPTNPRGEKYRWLVLHSASWFSTAGAMLDGAWEIIFMSNFPKSRHHNLHPVGAPLPTPITEHNIGASIPAIPSSVPNYSLALAPSIPNSYSSSDRPDGCLTFDKPISIPRKRPSAIHHGVHIRLCPRCPLYEPHREWAR